MRNDLLDFLKWMKMPDLVRNMKYSTKNRCGWGVYCKNETDKKVGRIENIQNRKIYRIEKYTE